MLLFVTWQKLSTQATDTYFVLSAKRTWAILQSVCRLYHVW